MNSLHILEIPIIVKEIIGCLAFARSPLMAGLLILGMGYDVAISNRWMTVLSGLFAAASVALFVWRYHGTVGPPDRPLNAAPFSPL